MGENLEGGSIVGTVIDLQNNGLANVLIVVTANDMPQQQLTDALGKYSFEDLPPSFYSLTAQLDGYIPFSLDNIKLQVYETKIIDIKMTPVPSKE